MMSAYEGTYHGIKAIWLRTGSYEAALLPQYGGNLIAFRDVEHGYHFLHEPTEEEMGQLKENITSYGIPFLFPPNRYEDGKFPWNGKIYEFPINEPETGNHLHGFLHDVPWTVENFGGDEQESYVTVVQHVDENHPSYKYLPHIYTIRLRYTLSKDGLHLQVMIENKGTEKMPCLYGFHTAINAPFAKNSTADDYTVKLTIGNRWELDERMLPTGKFQPLSEHEQRLKTTGTTPYFEALDNHYTAEPQDGRNRMELTDNRNGVTLVYDVGTAYKHWMLWNCGNSRKFFCPEPQINVVNAPNLSLPNEEIGLIGIEPGDIWEETSRLYIKKS